MPPGPVIRRDPPREGRPRVGPRLTRIALAASLALNVVLIAGIWLYVHFAGMLAIITDAVGFLG